MARLAILASGTGSNFAALCDAVAGSSHVVAYLVCNVPSAPVIEKAEARSITVHVVPYDGRSREEAESDIAAIIEADPVDLIALAGFMRVLSPTFVDGYPGPILNVHPSLLPKYPGMHAIERSYRSGDRELGVTVHRVDHGVDTGPVLAQETFERSEVNGLPEAEARIHEIEHQLYPEVVLGLLDSVGGTHR